MLASIIGIILASLTVGVTLLTIWTANVIREGLERRTARC